MKAATLDDSVGIFHLSPWKSTMFWVLLTSLLPLTAALQWTDSPTNHTQMTSCSNSDIYLPGNVTLSPGESIVEIKWFSRAENGSEDVLAIYFLGYFNPTTAHIGQVQWTGQAGIAISQADGPRSREFSVVVRTTIDNQSFLTYSRSFTVQITDPPTAKKGELKVRQESEAVYDNTTGEWRVQLTCGVLTDLGHPAVHPIWTTPEGHTMESSSQDNGTFRLLLPNPPSDGNYTCTLPPLSPAVRCLPPLSPLLEGASVTVDEIKARFTLLEARQRETETWKTRMREIRTKQEAKNEQQDQELMQVKSELEAEKTQTAMLRHNVSSLQARLVRDCVEAKRNNRKSGEVVIFPDNNNPLRVYCDQDTDGGGWLVFQRRQDGSVDFYRNWTSYQEGFGDVSKEFWLGLDALHMLTSIQRCELRVDLMKFDGTKGFATYSNFSISDSSDNYRLTYDAFTGGNASDSLIHRHKDQQFSTYDADHDSAGISCASTWHGAWWYSSCHHANLNGRYKDSRQTGPDGVTWYYFDNIHSLKFTEMKLRPL